MLMQKQHTENIGQWRRRLKFVVQQQGGHIKHLMKNLQDVTVTLDNN